MTTIVIWFNISFLAASGKFPDSLGAIKRIKAAFCCRIAKELGKQFKLSTTSTTSSVDLMKGKKLIAEYPTFSNNRLLFNCQMDTFSV